VVQGKPEKREQIIQVAAELVHIKGFNNTSVSDILKEAEIGKGQFYHYFESKEELGYAIIEYQFEDWNHFVILPAFDGADIRGLRRIKRLMDLLVKHFGNTGCQGGCPFANLALEMGDIHEGYRKKIKEVFGYTVGKIQKALDEAKRGGEIGSSVDTMILARSIFASIEGGIMLMKALKDISVLEQIFSELLKQIKRR